MTSLFNEQETIAIRRTESDQQSVKVHQVPNLDLTGTEKLIENLMIYGNPLLNASSELLGLLVSLPRQASPLDIDAFRQQLLDGIADFKRRGLFLDYHPSVIEKGCFVLCAAFDEIILYTAWGEQARWENHSLLSKVFNQRDGGEVFFQLMEQARRQPSKLVDFLELQYVLIMLGFLGKYRHSNRRKINELKSELYAVIRHYRDESALPVPQTPQLPPAKRPWQFLSVPKLLSLGLLAVVGSYFFSEFWYDNRSESTLSAFMSLDMDGFSHATESEELVYVSTPEDLGLIEAEPEATTDTVAAAMVVEWEVLLATFSAQDNAKRLVEDMKGNGYTVIAREVENGIELVVPNQVDLTQAKVLKNELNVRFGLNAIIRRSKQK
ncbi:type IVB secretion system protein IcmH/DotU [uncultured Photobacterium sp.]|uniref:type IVB secretion system protein IcmH/DotU n=1 Tax=uncultured Photobacterium sp. TaxID=173973 RepID=UPI0026317B00|nr:type IVB secretion system protein IcmH/DotU [uncultured Photobacterium sp.]